MHDIAAVICLVWPETADKCQKEQKNDESNIYNIAKMIPTMNELVSDLKWFLNISFQSTKRRTNVTAVNSNINGNIQNDDDEDDKNDLQQVLLKHD